MMALADRRADLNLQISLLAEHEVTRLIQMVTEMAQRMGIASAHDPELSELTEDVQPEKVLDKIFQPFFTTKPTGQGTGLGLSLSYDIIKAHGGEIKVETKEGRGSEFMIQLPVK